MHIIRHNAVYIIRYNAVYGIIHHNFLHGKRVWEIFSESFEDSLPQAPKYIVARRFASALSVLTLDNFDEI